MELPRGQRNLILWQMVTGFFAVWPALYGIVIFGALTSEAIRTWYLSFDMALKFSFQLLWLITLLAGVVLWIVSCVMSGYKSASPRFLARTAWATVTVNLTMAALPLTVMATVSFATPGHVVFWGIITILMAAYPLLMAWLWWKHFLNVPRTTAHAPLVS